MPRNAQSESKGRQRRGDEGATALQTVITLVIVGVLAYLAVPIWGQLVERSRAQSCQSNQRSIGEAIDMAKTDGRVPSFVGYFDSALDTRSPWGAILIPQYLAKPPTCPSQEGGLYNMTPFGQVRSDKGAGQYFFVNQGLENDHRLTGQ